MTRPAVEKITVRGPAGSLEAIAEDPQLSDAAPQSGVPHDSPASGRYAIVCHPHPLFGGTMDNKVVTTLVRAMHETGMPTLRFNCRGVGSSEGAFDDGIGETEDAAAVAAWGAVRWPGRQMVVAGFSFGAYVALRLAQTRQVSQLVTIAPPVARFDFAGLGLPASPWLVVQGDADDVVDPQSVIRWTLNLKPQPRLVVMPGVGHFFHGRLPELRDIVRGFILDATRGG